MSKTEKLRLVAGLTAILAPLLHSVTDAMEWYQHGFSAAQLWLNYLAFLPMPWLLLGIYISHKKDPGTLALAGALLYGMAFIYFAHTTLYALSSGVHDYQALWQQLGVTYTIHGALMVTGGLLFAWATLRARELPRTAVLLFGTGILLNLVLGILSLPEILQTLGTAIRNLGIAGMGYAIISDGLNKKQKMNPDSYR